MATFNFNGIDFEGVSTHPSRLAALADWLGGIVSDRPVSVTVASADASFRSYYRVRTGSRSYIVMDAPPPQEDTAPFHAVAKTLRDAGVAAPRVYGWAVEPGFMLLEDFGNATLLSRVGQSGPEVTLTPALRLLYEHALTSLVHLQAHASPANLPIYDEAFLRKEMELFRRWLVHRHLNLSWSTSDESHWRQTTANLVDDALSQPRVFVHRDYHSRNLMVLEPEESDPVRALLGVLDFQDAMHGPVFYDVVSLLKDCYVTLERSDLEHLLNFYCVAASRAGIGDADSGEQRRLFHAMGIQRHLKAAGIFARLWHRDGKSSYLEDIPRTLDYIVEAGQHDRRYAWCADWIQERVLPRLHAQSSSS